MTAGELTAAIAELRQHSIQPDENGDFYLRICYANARSAFDAGLQPFCALTEDHVIGGYSGA